MSEENKAIVVVVDAVAENSVDGYNQIMNELAVANADTPEGRLYHVACAKDSGYLVLDVWESRESFDQFWQTLGSVVRKLGGTPTEPQIYPLLNIITG